MRGNMKTDTVEEFAVRSQMTRTGYHLGDALRGLVADVVDAHLQGSL